MILTHRFLPVLCNVFRKDVVLPKTPAAKRQRKQTATKRSRALRSTTVRDSVDSGVELEMKKSRHQLDVVTEKMDEQAAKAVSPATKRSVEQAISKMDENKENVVDNGQVSASESKPVSFEKECEDVDEKQSSSASSSLPTSVNSNPVLTLVSSFYCFKCFC